MPSIVKQPLPYQDKLAEREMSNVELIVLHCTELPTMALAREFGERIHYSSGTGNSGHYYIDKAGEIYQYVADDHIAHHVANMNEGSIGIELINEGRYPNWYDSDAQTVTDPYTPQQIDALVALIAQLQQRYPSITTIAGHEDLDTRKMPAEDNAEVMINRKVDPGPLFPWEQVMVKVKLKRITR